MNEESLRRWLERYLRPQEAGSAEEVKELFAQDGVYWWGPFGEPRYGAKAIYEHHRNALSHQNDIRYEFEILAVRENYGLARFTLSLKDSFPGEPGAYEGIFQVYLNNENKCVLFKEWYNSKSNSNTNKERFSMTKEIIFTDKAPVPGGTYSQAVKIGNMVYVAGAAPFELNSTQIYAPGDLAAQTTLVLEYISHILEAAGSSIDKVVKVTSFVTDMERFKEYDAAYQAFFPTNPPARSTIEISKFPSFVAGMCVEIECVAYCD